MSIYEHVNAYDECDIMDTLNKTKVKTYYIYKCNAALDPLPCMMPSQKWANNII